MFALLSRHSPRRGQAVVETAIILPLLVLLLVMALDAGRLFFGWVALQNASRIGADYAASHADAWEGLPAPKQGERDHYALLVSGDLQSLGCKDNVVPPPNFDPDGDGTEDFADGALVRVDLGCEFDLLTPLAESFLGAPVMLHGRSDFAINRTLVSGLPPPGNPPPPVSCPPGEAKVPELVGLRNIDANLAWEAVGFDPLLYAPQPLGPNRNRLVTSQLPDANSCQPLNTPMVVTL
ncbi:MAG: TadE/TadG family type IV pilus assembly protein [Candidatus Limnocylindria bacterium]